ncbi:TlpA family protein disulfide reductase [Lacinutrix salivirga]
MKKLFICLTAALALFSCKEEAPKDYVTLSGKIENPNSDSLFVYQGRNFSKTIRLNEDGTFSDTLKVEPGIYGIYDGTESANLYLKNDYDLNLTLNTEEFDESLKFSGKGADDNNYMVEKTLLQEDLIGMDLLDLEEDAFNNKLGNIETELNKFHDKYATKLDSTFSANEKKDISNLKTQILSAYKQQKARKAMFAEFIGKPSPKFTNLENAKGGKTSLSDLKGKYVYVDVWATWCGPCIREIPSLKEVEKEFHDKNIEFVSLSVDDGRGYKGDAEAARKGWQEMVKEKELGGVQLHSAEGWKSEFVQGFKINGIPRFILIDPAGNVVDADAPRPSSPKLKTLFNSLENI